MSCDFSKGKKLHFIHKKEFERKWKYEKYFEKKKRNLNVKIKVIVANKEIKTIFNVSIYRFILFNILK